MLLNDDLKPIVENKAIYENLIYKLNKIEYQTIYNISTPNIGYTQARIIIDIKMKSNSSHLDEQIIKQVLVNDNFSNINCQNLPQDTIYYICSLDLLTTQQNFIEIIIQPSLQFFYRNLQIFVLQCAQNCALCQQSTNACLKCEDQYQLIQEKCLKVDDQIHVHHYSINYLGNSYEGHKQYKNKKHLLTTSIGDANNIILDYNTTNTTKEILINNQTQIGPFIQNEGIEYYNLSIHDEPMNIRIDYTIYLLYSDLPIALFFFQINGFENKQFLSFRQFDNFEDCYSSQYANCKIHKFSQFYFNITQIDNLKIIGAFPLQQKISAWALGNIKFTQFELLKCQYKQYQLGCFKQCPSGTKEVNNVCLSKIQEKFVSVVQFLFFQTQNFEFFSNNHIYIDSNDTYFKYDNIVYHNIKKSLQIDVKIKKVMKLYVKLIILDANLTENISINLANFSLTYNISDMEPLNVSLGSDEVQDYALEIENVKIEFDNPKGNSKLQIIRKGCFYNRCNILISELLILSPKCNNFCHECNVESGCIEPTSESQYCPQGYFYNDFQCSNCPKNCSRCSQYNYCIECYEGFVLFSGECYLKEKDKYSSEDMASLTNPVLGKFSNQAYTQCKSQHQVRNVEKCACQDGYIFNEAYECLHCDELCETCIQTVSHCQSCRSTQHRKLESGQCLCQEGYFEELQKQFCQQCLPKCKQCQYKEFICTECHLSQHRVLSLNDCICQDGYYHDFIQDRCLKCKNTCKNCKDYDTCIVCDELQFRTLTFQNQCICKQGYFLNNQICEPCHYSCLECRDSSEFNKCTKCTLERKRKSIQMDYFECLCQIGFYDVGQQECYDCQLFDNPPIDHYCYANCGDGIIQWNEECDNGVQTQSKGCHKCKLSQSKCQNEICQICNLKECVQCQDGYYLKSDYTCDKCSPICKTCKINPYNCIICADNNLQCSNCLPDQGYIYLENQCQSICGDGYITLEEQCDDGNLLDNDGCNSNCLIEHYFICGNTCTNKPSWHFQIQQNKFDKYYSDQRQYHITIKNYESNIDKEQLQLSYVKTNQLYPSNCGQFNYTISKSSISKIGYQQFIIKLHLYQQCIDQQLSIMLFNDSKIIYEKQIQIINYFTLQNQFTTSFNLLLYLYAIIFTVNFLFIQSHKYIEILFIFQMIAYHNHFEILTPKYFESFVELFSPYQMIISQQLGIQNIQKSQQETNQFQLQDNIVRQLIFTIILIVASSSLRLIVYILIRINQNRRHKFNKKLSQKLQRQLTYQLVYFLNYFSYQLYGWIILNQFNSQISVYIIFIIFCHIKIYQYFRNQQPIRFVVLLNAAYIFILMMMKTNQIFQLLLTSLIVGVLLISSIIEKNCFDLKYKLLLGNLWGTHFIYLIFELYTSTVQKYERLNQILGGVLIINYFILLLLQMFDILRTSVIITKKYYSNFKERNKHKTYDQQYFGAITFPSLSQI
ncbi:unnamed protein product (macronuclear) [Paramecium tetraurelia]|uniref:EGF-like domain-containing protein n=1 Tax=Paramecium tetraurelia TaxID=5888 RepID=A0EAK4_PARTE|nr:uncharacterized protein GSPATT00025055001 [Paramecium tetraurelia]CAK92321.1 unnamed protein product [Paramecium tetraurelia]|eukprot:XP_001459718.1 hypothetical protein (macronuclear) [Paramecium tetraurelia strain d4-2]